MIPICPCYTLDIAANESRAQSPYQGLKYCPFDWLHRNQFCFCHGKSDPDGYILQEAQTLCSLYLWPPRWSLCICICTVWQQQSTHYVPEDWFLRILRCPRAVRCPASGAHGHGHTHMDQAGPGKGGQMWWSKRHYSESICTPKRDWDAL